MNGIDLSKVDAFKNNPHSNFDLSFKRKFDSKIGDLVPSLVLPVIPDDEISISHNVLMRMAPFVQQVYQDYRVVMAYYYVPNRVLWHNFSKFMVGGFNGRQEYVHPYIDLSQVAYAETSLPYGLFDYFDVPPYFASNMNGHSLNALPFAAYLRVILDYFLPHADTPMSQFREMFNQEQLLADGDNTFDVLDLLLKLYTNNPSASHTLLPDNAAYGFGLPQALYPLDYFTSARPSTQHGPAMTIPLKLVSSDSSGMSTFVVADGSSSVMSSNSVFFQSNPDNAHQIQMIAGGLNGKPVTINGSIFQNAALINDFYQAARCQELLTLYGYSGLTSDDKLAAEFGVSNPNSSLQRAELVGYDVLDVGIGEVFSADVSQETEVGAMIAGVGTAVGKLNGAGNGFRRKFFEHGYLIGISYCYPEASYQDGLPRHLMLNDRFDYPHPLFANIGMQAIKRYEIDIVNNDQMFDSDFAYQPRYADYKVGINRVNGSLRDSLSSMTAGRKFFDSSSPQYVNVAFNDRFLKVDPSMNNLNRTFNVNSNLPTDKPLFFDIKFNINANRALPYYGLPKF